MTLFLRWQQYYMIGVLGFVASKRYKSYELLALHKTNRKPYGYQWPRFSKINNFILGITQTYNFMELLRCESAFGNN